MLAGELDEARQERQLHALRRRVRGEVHDQRLRPRRHARNNLLELLQKLLLVVNRNADDVRARDHRTVNMNRVRGVGHQHRVARVQNGQTQMRDALLRSDRDNGLGLRIELHAVARPVPVANGLAQPRQAARDGIAMRGRLHHRFHQLVHDVPGSGAVGVAHAEVDDVFAALAGGLLHGVGNVKDVSRQTLNARKFFHDDSSVTAVVSGQ